MWPDPIDAARAAQGRAIFDERCGRCHGTYGAAETYPDLVIGLDEVGTDGTLALGAGQFADRYTVLPAGQDTRQLVPEREIYDTTLLGYGNGGHTFGDALSAPERDALLEYLKTL